MLEKRRSILYYGKSVQTFLGELPEKVLYKIGYVFELLEKEERIPARFLKYLENTDGLYEIRIMTENNIYRIFCCFDAGNLIILLHGFRKKTQKTPKKEIQKALSLKKAYFNEKYNC